MDWTEKWKKNLGISKTDIADLIVFAGTCDNIDFLRNAAEIAGHAAYAYDDAGRIFADIEVLLNDRITALKGE